MTKPSPRYRQETVLLPRGALPAADAMVMLAVLTQPRPTHDSVMLRTGVARGSVHKALVRLRQAGLLTWESNRMGTIRPSCVALRAPNRSTLAPPEWLESTGVFEGADWNGYGA